MLDKIPDAEIKIEGDQSIFPLVVKDMLANSSMKKILEHISIDHIKFQENYTIWKKINQNGQPYWGVGEFCGLAVAANNGDRDLTELEWDGNEINIDDFDDILSGVVCGIGIAFAWKIQMERDYADTVFDIILSVDVGDEDVSPSVTLRFWAVREAMHYVFPSLSALQKFSQPVLMVQANSYN